MNEHGIEDVINKLYEMIQDARNLPLSADKCIVDRDGVLDLLDEMSNQLPGEIKQAKTIVESRGDVINNAKREAESILKQAQAKARRMIDENEITRRAEQEANAMIQAAQDKIRELKNLTNSFVEDSLCQTEQAITEALDQVKLSREKFNALVGTQGQSTRFASNSDIPENAQ